MAKKYRVKDRSKQANEFAFRLKRLRAALSLEQSEMAILMGIGYSGGKVMISRWEKGKHVPRAAVLRRLEELEEKVSH